MEGPVGGEPRQGAGFALEGIRWNTYVPNAASQTDRDRSGLPAGRRRRGTRLYLRAKVSIDPPAATALEAAPPACSDPCRPESHPGLISIVSPSAGCPRARSRPP